MKKYFWLAFFAILILSFAIRIIPPQNHNFFFTMDQADDGVWTREFFERGQILWHGSRTNIPGVYAGPIWYYFISIGYILFRGDPFGAVFMVIVLNVFLTGLLMLVLRKKVGIGTSLLVGLVLQFFWWFYDTSRWAFNPFPMVATSLATVLLLVAFLEGKKKAYILAAIPVFLGFNFEVAGTVALFIFYVLVGVWGLLHKKLSLRLLLPAFAVSGFFCLVLFYQLLIVHFVAKLPGQPTGYFSGTNFIFLAGKFAEIFTYPLIPYHFWASLLLLVLIAVLFTKSRPKNKFIWY